MELTCKNVIESQPKTASMDKLPENSSWENLLSQNELLSTQLRQCLKSIHILEEERSHLENRLQQLWQHNQELQNQMTILLEKEKKYLLDRVEAEEMRKSLEIKNQQLIQLQGQINRFKKYQEKIKKFIRPYIQELRNHLNNLQLQNEALLNENANLRLQLTEMNDAQIRLKQAHQSTIEDFKKLHEKEKERWQNLLEEYKLQCQMLETKAQKVDIAAFRQNELQNQLIRLEKEAQAIIKQLKDENLSLRKKIESLNSNSSVNFLSNLEWPEGLCREFANESNSNP